MNRWQKILAVVAVILFLVGVSIIPYMAAQRATEASIHSAEAAEKSQQSTQILAGVASAEQRIQATADGVQSLLQYVSSVQNGAQATASRESAAYVVAQLQQICEALGKRPAPVDGQPALPSCHIIPLPASLQPSK